VAKPRKKPKKREASELRGVEKARASHSHFEPGADESGTSFRRNAAKTMAIVSVPAKGMSVAAAWEKPIMTTVVGSRRSSQRAACPP